jgi:hypothetical protein
LSYWGKERAPGSGAQFPIFSKNIPWQLGKKAQFPIEYSGFNRRQVLEVSASKADAKF